MRAVPETITTQRLLMRKPTLADASAIFEYAGDPEVTRFMDWPKHQSIDTVIEYVQRCSPLWESGEEYTWVITLLQSQQLIGAVSCRVRGPSADFGYVLNRRFWGQGISTEAARAVVDITSKIEGLTRIWASCDVDNLSSARVLEKVGLTREGTLRAAAVRPNLTLQPRDAVVYAKRCLAADAVPS
jgi:ribosomal-protein-alanine N-acetyltransferase